MDHYITIQPKEDVMHTTTANPLTAKKTLNLPAVRTERNLRRANKNKKSKARPSRSPLGSLSSSNANALEKRDANQKVQQWANATKRVLQRTDHLVQSVMSRYTSTTDVDQFIKKVSNAKAVQSGA